MKMKNFCFAVSAEIYKNKQNMASPKKKIWNQSTKLKATEKRGANAEQPRNRNIHVI